MSGRYSKTPLEEAISHGGPTGEAAVHAWVHVGTEMAVLRHRGVVLAERLSSAGRRIRCQGTSGDDEESGGGKDCGCDGLHVTSWA